MTDTFENALQANSWTFVRTVQLICQTLCFKNSQNLLICQTLCFKNSQNLTSVLQSTCILNKVKKFLGFNDDDDDDGDDGDEDSANRLTFVDRQ